MILEDKQHRCSIFAKAIEELSLAALQARSLDDLCTSAARATAISLDADFTAVSQLTGTGDLRFRATCGVPDHLRVDGVAATPNGFSYYVALHEGTVWSRDISTDDRFVLSPTLRETGARSAIAAPLLTEDGRPWGTIAAFFLEPRDFTEEESRLMFSIANIVGASVQRFLAFDEAQQERQERETDLRFVETVLETSPAMVVLSDQEGRILRINRATETLLNMRNEEIRNKPFWDLGLSILESDQAFEAFEDLQSDKPPAANLTTTLTRLDGEERRVTWSIAPVEGLPGEQHLFVSVGVDITEQLKAEEDRETLRDQLLHAQKMDAIGRVVGGVAHDFNNILMVLRTNAIFLDETLDARDPRKQDVAEILSVSERAQRLVRQLLSFSRKDPISEQLVDVSHTVAGMREMLRQMIRENVTIRIDTSEPAQTSIDPSHLEQVILNLVLNAREAMPKGGDLTITSGQIELERRPEGLRGPDLPPGPYAVLEVSDTGSGIPAEVLPNIFEPFFTTKPRNKGTGLGLSTVYGIVERAHGSIAVSTTEGVGTTFTVYLPHREGTPIDDRSDPTPPVSMAGNEKVLVVEDEPAVRDLVMRILVRAGYQATAAEDGIAALRSLANDEDFDLMITDVVMPGLSGTELVERAKELHAGLSTLLMSGYVDDGSWLKECSEPHPVLLKPFTPDALLRAVRTTLDQERTP